MAVFAVLTLVPSTIAVGSALGLSKQLVGAGSVAQAWAHLASIAILLGGELNAVLRARRKQ